MRINEYLVVHFPALSNLTVLPYLVQFSPRPLGDTLQIRVEARGCVCLVSALCLTPGRCWAPATPAQGSVSCPLRPPGIIALPQF